MSEKESILHIIMLDGTWIWIGKRNDLSRQKQLKYNKKNWLKYGYEVWKKYPDMFNQKGRKECELYHDHGIWVGDYSLMTDYVRAPDEIKNLLREARPDLYP